MYDAIVIGGGHAGVEASVSLARKGLNTLLITTNLEKVGNMPCNPSMGGPAKGIIIKEIDALGGVMGQNVDQNVLQMKLLNDSKGPAVQALRAQVDKVSYPKTVLKCLKAQKNLTLLETSVEEILFDGNKVTGVRVKSGEKILAKGIVLSTGTYLKSVVLRGKTRTVSGPEGDITTSGISKSLIKMGFKLKRFKTGTPPRLLNSTIDFTKLIEQNGDSEIYKFSELTKDEDMISKNKRVKCYLTFTSDVTHKLILDNLSDSSMYGGMVKGVGPRYCPSIEDKVVRFNDKERHQIFLEPESIYLNTIYTQGLSTSFSEAMQEKVIHSVKGLEKAEFVKYAYAIEYDAIDAQVLKPSLEAFDIENLFFAGQINGTSGYEEAAAQGLMAGINLAHKLKGEKPLVLKRDEAYIGVLIDDLIIKGVIDPYRMLTSRADYRLLLRNDNAEDRLLKYGYEEGLVSLSRYQKFLKKVKEEERLTNILKEEYISPTIKNNKILESLKFDPINQKLSLYQLLKRPNVDFKVLEKFYELSTPLVARELSALLTKIKYEGYILKEKKQAEKLLALETVPIPTDINYDDIKNLASEAREKLKKIRPTTLAQAQRISGVNPTDVSLIMIYIEAHRGR